MNRIILLCTVFLCLSLQSLAQVSVGEKGSISGKVYADYYWMAQNNNSDIEGKNGFWIRRIYLTYEREFSDAFSSRLRLEMNSAGDFESDPEMIPNVKDAYLKWQNERHQILAGISSAPTWGLVEDVWGYRSVEKSPLDLYDFGSSRDFGLSFKGELDQAGKLNYHFFFGNGNSNKPDINSGKKLMLSLGYEITDHIIIEGYVDYNNTGDDPTDEDSYTAQAFGAYQSDNFTLGALYAYQKRETSLASDLHLDLISVFANARLNENVNGYFRVDHMFDPYIGGSGNSYIPFAEGVESTFIVGGIDITLEDQIHLMPNIEAIAYGENLLGERPDTDLIPRLTLFYKF